MLIIFQGLEEEATEHSVDKGEAPNVEEALEECQSIEAMLCQITNFTASTPPPLQPGTSTP